VTTLDIIGFDNEDIYRTFSLQTGTASSYTPVDITSIEFEMNIVDAKTGALYLRCTTNESDLRMVKLNPAAGIFELKIGKGLLPYVKGRAMKYDLLRKDALGVFTRLFGGAVKISKGITVPA
jgi:hypothetical protein